jgi:hypothetical protein
MIMKLDTASNIQPFAKKVLAHAKSNPQEADQRVVVGIDECVATKPIKTTLNKLLIEDVIGLSRSFWQEIRKTQDGEIVSSMAEIPSGVHNGFDAGVRILGDSWPDFRVVEFALAHLYSYRTVIVLSANRRGDQFGLRSILHRGVGPLMNTELSHGRMLTVLLQRPKTTSTGYASRVEVYLRNLKFKPGFGEVVI